MSTETAVSILNGLHVAFFVVLILGTIAIFYTAMMHAAVGLPYVRTLGKRFPYIFDELQRHITVTPNTLMVDLGSGLGHILFEAERRGMQRLIGYELSPWHVTLSKIKATLTGSRVKFLRKNFLKADFSDVDIFYFFLTPSAIATVAPKVFREGKKGALVISLADKIEDHTPISLITTPKPQINIYFYRID